jgi:hypothetical protein
VREIAPDALRQMREVPAGPSRSPQRAASKCDRSPRLGRFGSGRQIYDGRCAFSRYERYEEARRQTCSDSPRDSSSINLDELRERAQTQRDMLECERVAASREALQGDA